MKERKPLPDYARYSGLGLQMAVFIVICTFAGKYLDSFHWVKFPLFTICFLIFGVFGAMYYMIRQLK
ncbi:MAG: AtpZ/AtpI family protein [Chitinophagaceae bacterium]